MEFKDRQAAYPGRIKLKDVQTGEEKTYDLILADGATELGTPINAQTLNELKEDILNQTADKVVVADKKDLDTTTINGKLVINPAYDTTTNSYNEGVRINKASNGWSVVELGGENNSTYGASDSWLIGRRGAIGATKGAVGDLTIECGGAAGNGLTLYKNGSAPTWGAKKVLLSDMFTLSGTTLTIKL